MIYLPNKFERYTAALRNTVQLSVIKNGLSSKALENLMKIHRAEALLLENLLPINIAEFSQNLLAAAFIKLLNKNKNFHFDISVTGTFMINPKTYSALLLTLCRTSNVIKIKIFKEKIVITADNSEPQKLLKLISALRADFFFETKRKIILIALNTTRTGKKSIPAQKEFEYILNPFSAVNIYLV